MRDPVTPGGFNGSMACKPASNSATGEDMTRARASEDEKYATSGASALSKRRAVEKAIDQVSSDYALLWS